MTKAQWDEFIEECQFYEEHDLSIYKSDGVMPPAHMKIREFAPTPKFYKD